MEVICQMTVKKDDYQCPYRDDIVDTKKIAEKTHTKVTDIYDKLFVKLNGDPLIVMIEKNTKHRVKLEYEKNEMANLEKRSKWSRRGFFLAIITFIISNVFIIIKMLGV